MRIRLVTQWYPPEPAGVPAGIAHGLAARGHAVDVLTGFPNYPTGRLVEGYPLRPYRRDVDRRPGSEVVVHRAPLFPSHDARALTRMANYLSFATSATALAVARLPRPDVWLTYSSPATAALPALTARLADRVRGAGGRAAHAQIVQDLWPDSVMAAGFVGDSRAARLMESGLTAFCSHAFAHTDAVGVISPGMRAVLVERGVPDDAVVDTPNAVDARVLPRLAAAEATRRRHELGLPTAGRLFVYAGNLGELQNLTALVDAFARVPEASLALIGPGVMRDRLQRRIESAGLANVRLLPAQPPERIDEFLTCADVLVVSLTDTPLLRVTMPSKVASCLGAGRPVLAHAAGDVADVVENAGGLSCPPGDPTRTASAIARMAGWSDDELARRGDSARSYYETHMNTESCRDAAERLVDLAARRAGERRAPRRRQRA
ncbi:glycosyltransferase family 4 protein [Mobilicoccus massiliensis]|uniref:glycosyltransferase family 4 protein n=1 Tax=Mobilicoccus massiliensis TaxID=1522310 RepID=UPI00058F2DFC|nr:glycosyltransferase family 4 protein [Mobilicoccus massiliensis]